MMLSSCGDRTLFRAGRGALALSLLLSAAACHSTTKDGGAPYVLTAYGDPVRADSPPGIEVTLGGKRVLQAGEPSALD
jgi:hypothetical protein